MKPYRIFECFNHADGDPVRWIASRTEQGALDAAQRRGWTRPTEITPVRFVPEDARALKVMGCDVIVKDEQAARAA